MGLDLYRKFKRLKTDYIAGRDVVPFMELSKEEKNTYLEARMLVNNIPTHVEARYVEYRRTLRELKKLAIEEILSE